MLTADHHPHGRGRAARPGAEVPHPDRRLHVRPRRRHAPGRRAGQGGSTPVTTEAPRLAAPGGDPRAPAQSRTGTAISLGAITVQIHGPSSEFAAADVTVELNATHPQDPFITIMWPNGVRVYLDDGEADYLIKVILQAKDMLAAHRNAVACHSGLGEYVNGTRSRCPADWGSGTESQRCPWLAGHGAVHRDNSGHEWTDGGEGLPVAEDDGGDGDDDREPYCVTC